MQRLVLDFFSWTIHVIAALAISGILVSAVTGHGHPLPVPGGTQSQP